VSASSGPSIEEVIAAVPAWAGRAVAATPIAGGLTNRNFRVDVDGRPHFVRIPGPGTDLLAVDRDNELHNTRAAARAGAGPEVVYHLPRWDVIVLEWLDARTMSNAAFAAPREPARIAAALRQLHAGPRFRDDFDMVALSRLPRPPRLEPWTVPPLQDRGAAQVAADAIRALMWDHAGIARNSKGLRLCIAALADLAKRLPEGATEERNLADTALLIAEAALLRKESRGGHFRRDFPREKRKWRGMHIEW